MIIFDASTLILLAKIDILKIVIQNHDVLISEEVESETTQRSDLFDAQLIKELIKKQQLEVVSITNRSLLKKLQKDFVLARGEASAIVLAQEKRGILATDDGQTIKACKILGIRFITAIHFLLDICERKEIKRELAIEKLERLKKIGRYNDKIISDARARLEKEA